MIIVVQHNRGRTEKPIIELHCPLEHAAAVRQVIRQVTEESPVPVPIDEKTVAYFVGGLDLEEAFAILRMIVEYGEDPEGIDRDLIAAEVALERQDQARVYGQGDSTS